MIPQPVVKGLFKTFVFHPEYAERVGFQVYPKVFYSPFPDPSEIDLARLRARRPLPGIDFSMEAPLKLLEQLIQYAGELAQFPRDPATGSIQWSHTFHSHDAAALYTMIRHLKPRRYIEVGCGYSTRSSTAALARNAAEGHPCQSLFIEPYPAAHLDIAKLNGEFLKKRIEQVPVERFQILEAGDLLFIDTSHVVKVQNDVEYEYVHILPSLKKGVYVHIHDIFSPYDYPEEWLVGNGPNRGGCNEQYVVEAMMSGGGDWRVTLPVHLLWREHRAGMERLFGGSKDRPSSFYIQKVAGQ